MQNKNYSVGTKSYKVIGYITIIFFSICTVGALWTQEYSVIPIFLFFAFLGVYALISSGEYHIDEQGITHQNMLGTYYIMWIQIRKIEVSASDGAIILHGDNKRFAIAPPSAWSGQQKPEAYSLFAEKIEQTGAKQYPSNTAAYKTHKNVKVKK